MSTITLTEAIEALKQNSDAETVGREITILEGECKKLSAEITAKRKLMKTLRGLAGISGKKPARTSGGGTTEGEAEILPPLVQKIVRCLSAGGPMRSDAIARQIDMGHGPVTIALNKREGQSWLKKPDGRWCLPTADSNV